MRYVYLGDALTDPALKGQPCDPVRRPDGRCIVGRGVALVRFEDGVRSVLRRRLRLAKQLHEQHHDERLSLGRREASDCAPLDLDRVGFEARHAKPAELLPAVLHEASPIGDARLSSVSSEGAYCVGAT